VSTIAMPRLSDSMEEGTIVRWLKADGDEVRAGDELVEIETDKATMTYEAESSGVLRRLVGEGETVALGAAIAELASGRVAASPVARRLAAEHAIDLAALAGTGPRGRVIKRDIERALTANGNRASAPPPSATASPPAASPPPAASTPPAATPARLSAAQRTIARRMAESRASVPDINIEVEVDADPLLALREQLRARDVVPSINDFIVRAAALALREHPRVNGSFDGGFAANQRVNVGIAVAAPGNLLVPVIEDADLKSLGTIARESRALAEQARDGVFDGARGTFTVSNLGMLGVTRFDAVVNLPQAAILAVGAIRRVPVVRADAVVPGHVLSLTLCADHRIVYGADAARFLADVREALEQPLISLI
jgi:pyruvate dehydrogenase E2 component (dihydrolipoamide acetyltransferase)